jgi:hypothetical protein
MELKVHYVVHNSPTPDTIFGQIKPVYALLSYLLEINFNIQHLCLGFASGFFPSGFPTKTLYTPLILLHIFHMPAHITFLDFTTQIIFLEEYK